MKLRLSQNVASELVARLKPFCLNIAIAGSVRRKMAQCNDIEIVLIRQVRQIVEFKKVIDSMTKLKGNALGAYTRRSYRGFNIDIFMVETGNWGLQLAIRTGNAEYSRKIAARWSALGFKSVKGYLHRVDSFGNILPGISMTGERGFFGFLGIEYLDPWERTKNAYRLLSPNSLLLMDHFQPGALIGSQEEKG